MLNSMRINQVGPTLLDLLASPPLVRRGADMIFRAYARRRVLSLDRLAVEEVQKEILLSLVRHCSKTRFGKDHDFAGIHIIKDYQARVPLRDYDAFWRDYWQPAFPRLSNLTWSGRIPYLALSSGTTTGSTKYLPVSAAMLASNRRAARTALAWLLAAQPNTRLFAGKMFFLGGSTDLAPVGPDYLDVLAGDLSGIAAREIPAILRPFAFPPLEVALERDWDLKLNRLASQGACQPVTLISGVPSWLLLLFDRLRQVTGRDTIANIWPTLEVVAHGGTSFEPYRSLFRQVIGKQEVQFLESYPASEGFVAAEDPRHGLLRLIPDHGIFFEFVPVEELGANRPTRHTAAEVISGIQYAVVLTTCAGLWSYILGDTVRFEQRDPPLLRFTGRMGQYLSAFGEHLIGEELERAVAMAAEATAAAVVDFHVGPVFPISPRDLGRHRYLVEFAQPPQDLADFAGKLDQALCEFNEDYRVHRTGNLSLGEPEILPVAGGGFAGWMRSRGQFGGQHKLPRLDNTGRLTEEIIAWLKCHQGLAVLPWLENDRPIKILR